jgi:hypothetical protein
VTLEDAFNGLLQYLQVRPDGGNRAELIQLAVQRGFQEPLLNEWLDVFLQGFVDLGFLTGANYDDDFAPRVEQVGFAVASRAARAVFLHLTESRRELDIVRMENSVAALNAQLTTLNNQLGLIQNGRNLVQNNFPANATRVATLAAIDFAIAHQQRQITSVTQRRDTLLEEIALAQG